MKFVATADSDVGILKSINQDSVLISHWFDFENADEAMKKASFKKDDVMKIMIRC